MLRILVVCTGNTCRSPMAEALLKDKISRNGLADKIMVLSAGVAAGGEYAASFEARLVMENYGLDISAHRSRQLLPDYIKAADLVLTMTAGHKAAVLALAPQAAAKVFTLTEYAGVGGQVADPFGGGADIYQMCARQLQELVDRMWEKILRAAGESA